MDFKNDIITEDHGMCNGRTYYSIEELYQAFKDRLIEERFEKIESTLEEYQKLLDRVVTLLENKN